MTTIRRTTRTLTVAGAAALLLAWPSAALADGEGGGPPDPPPADPSEPEQPSSGLSDTETSYTGAIMLRGGQEVTMESVVPGYVGDESYQADGRYAYFAGNTLYAGVKDDQNNYVDMIAEFFWFESSIDRNADFYVAVVKARTSPNLKSWVLERKTDSFLGYFLEDTEATAYLRAQTDVASGDNAFRWDWSIPFDNYGWDTYGNVTMETKYGLSVDAEGSAQKAIEYPVNGVPIEAKVQAKGFFSKNYQVQTRYEVTLYRWEIAVHGSAGQIDWQMNLHSKDREKQNAYHEYFIAMQSQRGVPFKLDWLEVGGSMRRPVTMWFDEHRSLSAAVTGIVLRPPQLPPPPPSGNGQEPTDPDPDVPGSGPTDPGAGPGDGSGDSDKAPINNYYYEQGCSHAGGHGSAGWLVLVAGLGLLGAARRRERGIEVA